MNPCRKAAYSSSNRANRAARSIHRSGGPNMRSYRCPACNRWHLSSSPRYSKGPTPPPPNHRIKPGRRLKDGETVEDLARRMRGERTTPEKPR